MNENLNWTAISFGIKEADILWYNPGHCYDRVIVKTKAAAKKVAKSVEGRSVNGGIMHGRMLGEITETIYEGKKAFEVMC
jgi:hypothetical protein